MSASYVELGASSAFSFLEGASLPEDLASRGAELDYPTLALCDQGGVYGLPRFHRAMATRGLRAIVGARLAVTGIGEVRLLCESRRGYQNLCLLLSRGHMGRPKGECEVSADDLEKHAHALTCLCGPRLHDGNRLKAAITLKRIFSNNHLALEVCRHLDRAETQHSEALLDLATATGIPAVATNDVRYARRTGKLLHDILTCAREHTSVDKAGRKLLPNAEWHLKPIKEMTALFADRPDTLTQSVAIAERCAFTLEDLGYHFPDFPVPPGATTDSMLWELTFKGARERYRPLSAKARAQLEKELRLIAKLRLAGYFLIVWDISRFAREQNILAQGRGSAANSAVCYSLGITAVDPVGMDLLFERFLSEERGEWPDIDIDLPSGDERERVIQYVYEKYGPHGTAMTANVITFRDKSAIREVGKALGFATVQVDRVAKLCGRWSAIEDTEFFRDRMKAAGLDPEARRVRAWVGLCGQLLHLPRHLGQHSGGMVIAAGRLDQVVPIEPASMPGRSVIQWDKDDCAAMKIIKVDLLGLGMLAALEEAVPLIAASEGITIDYAHLPQDDPGVFDMLCNADTVGVFQVESRAQMATLPRLQPRCFYDLVIEIALIRPGPISGQMVHPYLRRRRGREPVVYPHPALEPILKRTLGVPIFQEQLMRMAMAVAGFSGGEAEELRRAMGFKRANERMQDIEGRLRAGMSAQGLSPEVQDQITQSIVSFAAYGFPESHSASFALIAYASAYLKLYHPAAFLAALLNAWPMGFYHPATLVKDAQRHGVRVLPIDITRSVWRSTLPDPHTVRLGLRFVNGLQKAAAQRIEIQRQAKPFSSLADFERRCRLSNRDLATLAELGAFAELGRTRRQSLWQVLRLRERTEGLLGHAETAADAASPPPHASAGARDARREGDAILSICGARSNAADAATPPHGLREMSHIERILADYQNSGMTVGAHPMQFIRQSLSHDGVLSAMGLRQMPDGSRARVAGLVTVSQRPRTAKGFLFITLEDETGFANIIVTQERFEQNRKLILSAAGLLVEGVVQNREEVTHLKADRLQPIHMAPEAQALAEIHPQSFPR